MRVYTHNLNRNKLDAILNHVISRFLTRKLFPDELCPKVVFFSLFMR